MHNWNGIRLQRGCTRCKWVCHSEIQKRIIFLPNRCNELYFPLLFLNVFHYFTNMRPSNVVRLIPPPPGNDWQAFQKDCIQVYVSRLPRKLHIALLILHYRHSSNAHDEYADKQKVGHSLRTNSGQSEPGTERLPNITLIKSLGLSTLQKQRF